MAELRWNPMLSEWVIVAADRQDRTFLPPRTACPLCPGDRETGSEVGQEQFDVAVFENRFPALRMPPTAVSHEGTVLAPAAQAGGVCEVVVYSPRHDGGLKSSSLSLIRHLIGVWAHRTIELYRSALVEYVFAFENRGEAIGVTLHHPHGQIYAYPFVPPILQREADSAREHHQRTGRCLWCEYLAEERAARRRIVVETPGWTTYVPFFARWPYEVHLVPSRHVGSLPELSELEVDGLARAMKAIVTKYDGLFGFDLPYVMAVHQRPPSEPGDTYHLHLEFMPRHRTATKLKYLAGSEVGAGTFVTDTVPEETAAALRGLPPTP